MEKVEVVNVGLLEGSMSVKIGRRGSEVYVLSCERKNKGFSVLLRWMDVFKIKVIGKARSTDMLIASYQSVSTLSLHTRPAYFLLHQLHNPPRIDEQLMAWIFRIHTDHMV